MTITDEGETTMVMMVAPSVGLSYRAQADPLVCDQQLVSMQFEVNIFVFFLAAIFKYTHRPDTVHTLYTLNMYIFSHISIYIFISSVS